MSITSGTYTFGAGGTYPSLWAAWADMYAGASTVDLAGPVVFNQVGDSDDTGKTVGTDPSGFSFGIRFGSVTVKSLASLYGSPLTNYKCIATNFRLNANTITLDSVYFKGIGSMRSSTWANRGATRIAISCIFENSNASNPAFYFESAGSGLPSDRYLKCVNNKFISPYIGLQAETGFPNIDQHRSHFYFENNAFHVVGGGSGTGLWIKTNDSAGSTQPNLYTCKNNVFYLSNTALQRCFDFPTKWAAAYEAIAATNARNGGPDAAGMFSYSAIGSPGDIRSLDITQPGYLDLKNSSALLTAGGTPVLSENPYSAPYPIGIYYAYEEGASIITSGTQNLISAIPSLAGIGFSSPKKSRLLPGASASIAHARILSAYRDALQAGRFHDIIKAQS